MIDLRPFLKFGGIPGPWGVRLEKMFGVDLRSLALFRIGLALILLTDFIHRWPDITALYSDQGVLPRSVLVENSGRFVFVSLNFLSGSTIYQQGLFVLAGLAALAMGVGFRTKLCTFLSWIFLISLHERNPFLLNGGDSLLRILLFWNLFLPTHARYSLDSFLQRNPVGLPKRILTAGTVALYCQVAMVYWFAGIYKLRGADWRMQGTAVWHSLRMDQFAQPLGTYLLQYPSVLKFFTYVVVGYDLAGPFLLFSPFFTEPLRLAGIVLFWLMHLGFGLCMELGFFSWISAAALLAFLPSLVWDKWPASRKTQHELSPAQSSSMVSPTQNVLAALLLVYVCLWNITEFPGFPFKIRPPLRWVGSKSMLYQKWCMFSPNPSKPPKGWYLSVGRQKNGKIVDLLSGCELEDLERAPEAVSRYANFRWKHFLRAIGKKQKTHVLSYPASRYWCRDWNSRDADDDSKLQEILIYYLETERLPNGMQNGKAKKELLLQKPCPS